MTAILFDTNLEFSGNSSPLTNNYTCGISSKLLCIGIITAGTNLRTGGTPTYNGINLTQADQTRQYYLEPETSCELWYLINPPTGSSYIISIPNDSSQLLYVQVSSYKTNISTDVIKFDRYAGGAGVGAPSAFNFLRPYTPLSVTISVCGSGAIRVYNNETEAITLSQVEIGGNYSYCNKYKLDDSNGGLYASFLCNPNLEDYCIVAVRFISVAPIHPLSLVLTLNNVIVYTGTTEVINFGYTTGHTLAFIVYQPDGTVRTVDTNTLPEVGTTGYYTTEVVGMSPYDFVIVKDETGRVVGEGQFNPDVVLEGSYSTSLVNVYDERK